MNDTITITGNIGADPKLIHTAGGVPITTFSVASGQRRFDRANQQWVDGDPNWYHVSTFRALAVHAFESLHRGQRVVVTGRLRLREWSSGDRQGTAAEIDADAVGHDLLFGTTTFQKSSSRSSNDEPSAVSSEEDAHYSESDPEFPGSSEGEERSDRPGGPVEAWSAEPAGVLL